MARERSRTIRRWFMGAMVVALLLAFAGLAAPRRELGTPRAVPREGVLIGDHWQSNRTGRAAAGIDHLAGAVAAAERAVAAGDWPRAEQAASDLKATWLSFQEPMQAQAGREMWQTGDIDRFEGAVDGLIAAARARRVDEARTHVAVLREVLDHYTQAQGQLERRLPPRVDERAP